MNKFIYGLNDFANSAYTTIIITFIISAYFANQIVGNPQIGAAYWQWTAGFCGILIALTGPFIGAVADKTAKIPPNNHPNKYPPDTVSNHAPGIEKTTATI